MDRQELHLRSTVFLVGVELIWRRRCNADDDAVDGAWQWYGCNRASAAHVDERACFLWQTYVHASFLPAGVSRRCQLAGNGNRLWQLFDAAALWFSCVSIISCSAVASNTCGSHWSFKAKLKQWAACVQGPTGFSPPCEPRAGHGHILCP